MSEAREVLAAIQQRADAGAQTWEVGRGKFNTETNGEYIDALLATDVPRLVAFARAVLDLADDAPSTALGTAGLTVGYQYAYDEIRALADEHLTSKEDD